MVKILLEYSGDLHCEAVHGPSDAKLETDAPVDNQGRGESFSPTDLVATGLGACMATLMGIYARKHDIDLKGMRIEVVKVMSTEPPRRIAKLLCEVWMPCPENEGLKQAALTCPVHLSVHPDIERPVVFHWTA
jgi:putative redox protein